MRESMIQEATATGEQIFKIVSDIEPVLAGVSRGDAVIACLSIAISVMNPDISPEKLHDGVSGCSKWICLFLSGDDAMGVPKEQLN